MSGKIHHPEAKHPEAYQQDLNPHANASQNRAETPNEGKTNTRPASEIKALYAKLHDFTQDDLKRIPVLLPGSRLEQGATYLDLKSVKPHEFTAIGDVEATDGTWFVPKSAVEYTLWNRLRGISETDR